MLLGAADWLGPITAMVSAIAVSGIGAWALIVSSSRKATNEDTQAKVEETAASVQVLGRVYDDLAVERTKREYAEARVAVLERENLELKAEAIAAGRGRPTA